MAGSLLYRWGQSVIPLRWWLLIVPIALCLALGPLAFQATDDLSAGGWLPAEAESMRVEAILDDEFGHHATSHYLLFRDPTGELLATDPAFRREVERIIKPLRSDPSIASVTTWGTTTNRILNDHLISADRTMSIAIVALRDNAGDAAIRLPELQDIAASDRLDVLIGGWPATVKAFKTMTEHDLLRAERLSLPLTLVLLLLIFGGVIAAGLPVILAALSLIPTLAGITILSRLMETSLFAVNAVTMLGLAIGIDYALIFVSRYREELVERPGEDAIAATTATAGRSILISGAAVAIGLLGLMVFAVPASISTGIAGALVVLYSVTLALTALPAALALLGTRVARRRLHGSFIPERLRSGPRRAWTAVRARLQRRPGWVVIISCAGLLLLASPVRHLHGAAPTMEILPRDHEARQMYDHVATSFPRTTLSPIILIVEPRDGRMTGSNNLGDLRDFTATLAELDGVRDVDSIWSFLPPSAGPAAVSAGWLLDGDLREAASPYLTDDMAVIELSVGGDPTDPAREDLVRMLREDGYVLSRGAFDVLVGGETATNVDLTTLMQARAPWAVAVVLLTTWLVLLVQFRSLLLPVKAIVLNMLSLCASFGALVWIFQEGHLSGLLGFEPTGYTVLVIPILMFCFMFGLSMDYEVIMLSRIRETWLSGAGNMAAIDMGLKRSAHIVTCGAAVMLVIFAAFGASELQLIQAIGVGLGLAVLIDATLIRLVLLPATMQLMGDWNWWLPQSLRRSTRSKRGIHPIVGPLQTPANEPEAR